jgi:hypothetical protein
VVDRKARDVLAEQIRHLVAGQSSNDEFEDRLPESPDAAIWEVFWNGAWSLYDDLSEHKLRGPNHIVKEYRREVARWVLFLKSDLEYEWPPYPPKPQLLHMLLSIFTVGAYNRMAARRWRQNGETEVWPFIRRNDYERALATQPYLIGS